MTTNGTRLLQWMLVSATVFGLLAGPAFADTPTEARQAIQARDFNAAGRILQSAAVGGDDDAQYHLAALHRRGLGVPYDPEAAITMYEQLHAAGYPRAWTALGPRIRNARQLLADDVDSVDALLWAAERGEPDIVDALLQYGVDVDAGRTFGRTALIEAAEANRPGIIRRLIAAGADPDRSDDWNDTALIHAVRRGHSAAVAELLDGGADVNLAGHAGNTPLVVAAQRNAAKIAEMLIQRGALIDATNDAGQSPLGIAEVRRHDRLAASLRERGGTNLGFGERRRSTLGGLRLTATNGDGRPIWFIAAERGLVDALRTLASAGAVIDQRDPAGYTALMIAAERGYSRVVRVLLEKGADPRIRNVDGADAFELAVAAGRASAAEALMRVLPASASSNREHLILAVRSGSVETIALLADRETDDQPQFGNAVGAVMLASMHRDESLLVPLASAGISLDAFDAYNRNAAWYAADAGAARTIEWLAGNGVDLDAPDGSGNTPLHRAAMRGHSTAVRALLRHGADGDTENRQGFTPIMLAAIDNRPDVVESLLNAGHDINRKNMRGSTALHICVQRGNELAVKHLLKLGADALALNAERLNSFDVAEQLGYHEILAALRSG